jgi:hypothetical protein
MSKRVKWILVVDIEKGDFSEDELRSFIAEVEGQIADSVFLKYNQREALAKLISIRKVEE